MTPDELARAKKLLAEGMSPEKVARDFGMAYTTLIRKVNAAGYQIETRRSLVPLERVLLPGEVAESAELAEAAR